MVTLIPFLGPRIAKEDALERTGIKLVVPRTQIMDKTDTPKNSRHKRERRQSRKQDLKWRLTIKDERGHPINQKTRGKHCITPKRFGNMHVMH